MNALPYYKRYPRDFAEGTTGMPFELKGAYSIVLDLIYIQDGKLPDEQRYISGQLGMSVRKWTSIRQKLLDLGKIHSDGEFISNARADLELEITRSYRDTKRENRAGSNKNKDLKKRPSTNARVKPEPESKVGGKPPTTPKARLGKSHPPVAAPALPLVIDGGTDAQKPEADTGRLFEEFWENYPHRKGAKKGKSGAKKKFLSAVKSGASPAEIIHGARRYHDDAQVIRGYAKNPETWLNQKGWEDDIEPVNARQPSGTAPPTARHHSMQVAAAEDDLAMRKAATVGYLTKLHEKGHTI